MKTFVHWLLVVVSVALLIWVVAIINPGFAAFLMAIVVIFLATALAGSSINRKNRTRHPHPLSPEEEMANMLTTSRRPGEPGE